MTIVSNPKSKLPLALFYNMLRIRMIEEAIADAYPQGKMRCPVHLSIGQEAIACGVCTHLRPSDFLISNHRAHAHYLAKGGDLKRMIAEIYGKKTGCTGGLGGSMHLIDKSVGVMGTTPIVGGSIPVGVGMAFASVLKKEERITTIFFGEGATEEGVWAESLNFASLKRLPILFVCENNFYSVYSPLNVRQSEKRSRVGIARAHGIQALEGYGNDVEEVSSMTKKAIALIKEEGGPLFLEFDTYRYREHCGPNVDEDPYRSSEEIQKWKERCPLKMHEASLKRRRYIDDTALLEMEAKIKQEIDEAFSFAEQSPFPDMTLNEKSVYG